MTHDNVTDTGRTDIKAGDTPWQRFRKNTMEYLVPVNTVIALLTTVLSIVFDFLSPKWPVLPTFATVSFAILFLALLLYWFGLLRKLDNLNWFSKLVQPVNGPAFRIPLIGFAAISAGVFSVAAMASTKNAKDGGFLAGHSDFVKDLQDRFGIVNQRLNAIELKQDKLLGKQDEMGGKQDEVIHQIEALSKKLDSLAKDPPKNSVPVHTESKREVAPDRASVGGPSERRSTTTDSAGKPEWKAGDQWVFRVTSSLQGVSPSSTNVIKKITEANQQTKTLETAYGSTVISQVLDNDFKITAEHSTERSGVTYQKNYSEQPYFLKFPLQSGKAWNERFTKTTVGYQSAEYSIQSQVRGWETVEVPAGTFRAVRIDTVKTNLTSGITENIASWYSPEAAQVIRVRANSLDQGRLMKSGEDLISHNR